MPVVNMDETVLSEANEELQWKSRKLNYGFKLGLKQSLMKDGNLSLIRATLDPKLDLAKTVGTVTTNLSIDLELD